MNERVFVDTNVFLYAKDHRFREKQDRARIWLSALTARDPIVISPQVLGEMCNSVLRGRLPIAPDDMRGDTRTLERWSHGATDLELVSAAWTIREETGFQWWDCVLIGSAIRAQRRFLLTEDTQHGRTVRGTTIIDPLTIGPEAIATEH